MGGIYIAFHTFLTLNGQKMRFLRDKLSEHTHTHGVVLTKLALHLLTIFIFIEIAILSYLFSTNPWDLIKSVRVWNLPGTGRGFQPSELGRKPKRDWPAVMRSNA